MTDSDTPHDPSAAPATGGARPEVPAADVALRERLRVLGLARGLARLGFTGAEPVEDRASAWIARGAHASMEWMARAPERRADPRTLLPGAQTVICAAAAYPPTDARGPIAGYARGEDYHRTLRAVLEELAARVREALPGCETRVCVDAEPLLERAFAARAGLGWIGRSTLLLDERHGPWMLLGEILTSATIPPDAPSVERCGTCTACVDACPTGALDGARGLDARLCLSYWSIEHRGDLPPDWAEALGHRAFGCDDCLTACPFPSGTGRAGTASAVASAGPLAGALPGPAAVGTASAPSSAPSSGAPPFVPRPDLAAPTPDELAARAQESFRRHFGSTPLERARRGGFLRNLAAVRRNARRG